MHERMASEDLGNLSLRTNNRGKTTLLSLKRKEKRKEEQMSWGCFPKILACISRPFYLPSISLKVNSLWARTTSIRRPLLCKLLHLPAPAVAAPWPGLTATCLDRANAPFGSVPTSQPASFSLSDGKTQCI